MGCQSGKIQYKNAVAAHAAADKIQIRNYRPRAYQCEFCHEWHLTGTAKRKRPRTKERYDLEGS
jgi:cytochrome c553